MLWYKESELKFASVSCELIKKQKNKKKEEEEEGEEESQGIVQGKSA